MSEHAGFGETMDGPNTHKMDAPSDVTSWTVIPTTRNVVADDGRGMTLRDEWWHVPTFVADAIQNASDDFVERHDRASRSIAVNWFVAGVLAGTLLFALLALVGSQS